MGSVIPLKNSANSAYLDLRNLVANKLDKVEDLINLKLESKVNLIQKMTKHHLNSGGKRLRALLTLGSAKFSSGLGVKDFIISISYNELSKKGVAKLGKSSYLLSNFENLIFSLLEPLGTLT